MKRNKKYISIIVGLVIALCICIISAVQLIAASPGTGAPNPGHSWNQMECDNYLCVNTTSGNVGIGTASPSYKLDVPSGTANFSCIRLGGVTNCNWPGGSGGGTVTSITAGSGLTASPSDPITTSGTLNVVAGQGITVNADNVQVKDCAANQILKRNAGDTDWVCAADDTGGGSLWYTYTVGADTIIRPYISGESSHLLVDGGIGIGSAAYARQLNLGSASAYQIGNDFSTIYREGATGAGTTVIQSGNGATSFISIKDTGSIGIGTKNPGAKLEVAGQIKITGGSPGAGKVLTSDASGLASWQTAATATLQRTYQSCSSATSTCATGDCPAGYVRSGCSGTCDDGGGHVVGVSAVPCGTNQCCCACEMGYSNVACFAYCVGL